MDEIMGEENQQIELTQRFWAIEVEPGKPFNLDELHSALHITQVALDAEAKGKGRTALTVTVDGKKTTLGSCSDAISQFSLDLIFDDDESEIVFEAVGPNKLHVAGSYIVPEEDEGEFGSQFVEGEISGEDEEDEEDEEEIVPPPKADIGKNKQKKEIAQQQAQPKKRKNEEVEQKTPEADSKKAKTQTPKQTPPAKKETPKESPKEKNPAKKQLANGLVIEELVLGNGKEAVPGMKIGVKYLGKFTNGKTFDSSLNTPFSFRLGVGEVIKGWDEGLKGMRVGGKRKLVIPPSLGYKNQRAGDIPPNSTLVFEVELVRA